jgi:hypothetical protein
MNPHFGYSLVPFLRSLGRIAVLCGALAAFLFAGSIAQAASLSFTPASGNYSANQTFTVGVAINSEGAQVNSAQGNISFSPATLQVVSISRDGSPFNLWVEEPTFSNTAGTIKFSGGGTAALTGTRNIFSVTFRARAAGEATVSARDMRILAGAGQDVTGTIGTGTYTIAAAAPTPAPAPAPAPAATQPSSGLGGIGAGITPQPPSNINSPTHPEDDEWYATSTATFTWSVATGIVSIRTSIDESATSTPTEVTTPPIASKTYTDLEDGIWYFHLAFENRNGWGDPGHRRIQIDTIPPEEFELRVEPGDLSATLYFSTTDSGSGIAAYAIEVNGVQRERLTQNDLVDGERFTLGNLAPGETTFTVIASDLAGNTTSAEAVAEVTGRLPGTQDDEGEQVSLFGPVYWVSLIFAFLLAIVIGMLFFERKRMGEEKDRIKAEAIEASERLVSIFDVLREEIEEKVLSLSHKPNMTDTERQTLQALKEALDISEELLDKEIEDVRKLVK